LDADTAAVRATALCAEATVYLKTAHQQAWLAARDQREPLRTLQAYQVAFAALTTWAQAHA
jgi:hypothetical protein